MQKQFRKFSSSFFGLMLGIFVFGSYVIVAQNLTGTWKAKIENEKDGKIHLSFARRTDKGGVNQHGTSYDFSDLKGLSRASAQNGKVDFSLVREAGTIECAGEFVNGKGTGTFRFTADKNFVEAMRTRGFDLEKPSRGRGNNDYDFAAENQLFAAATLNVTTALADDLLAANLGELDVDDLFKAAIFKVDAGFVREMKDSGFPNLGMEELVKARIFKIDAIFLRELNAQGFGDEPFESVVKMRIFKITPEFITGVRAEGFQNLDIEDLVKMKIFNIDAAFIREARREGVPLEVEKLVEKRIGVWGK